MAMANIIGEHKAKSKKEKARAGFCGTRFYTAARTRISPKPATFRLPQVQSGGQPSFAIGKGESNVVVLWCDFGLWRDGF